MFTLVPLRLKLNGGYICNMLKQLPNALTLSNLASGILGIICVFEGNLKYAFGFMVLAAIFDFFDGFVARLVNAAGEMGKQLDSLADAVTFGVLPGFIWWEFMNSMGHCSTEGFCVNKYVFLAIPLAAVYRLALFNIDKRQSKGFIGVPTPITALAIGSMLFLFDGSAIGEWIGGQTYVMILLPFMFAYFMISDLEMFAFKFKKKDPLFVYKMIFLGLSLLLITLFHKEAGISIYALYIVISVLSSYFVKNHE